MDRAHDVVKSQTKHEWCATQGEWCCFLPLRFFLQIQNVPILNWSYTGTSAVSRYK